MLRVTPESSWPLHGAAAIRHGEQQAAAALPPHALMQRAGLAVARLALAIAPHARTVWVACGPGNNGGDGFEAALHLQAWGKQPIVSWLGDEAKLPADARASLQRARAAGVPVLGAPPAQWDLAVDALLGLGSTRAPDGHLLDWIERMNAGGSPVLAIDLPSGLAADTGNGRAARATHTLSLLALKPGLFTAHGRDAAGEVWFDDLGVPPDAAAACATLAGPPPRSDRAHASHKGSYGDVAVIGGASGMAGAALLAGRAALTQGAGRVYLALLDDEARSFDGTQPELMLRRWDSLDLPGLAVACGCGGGDAIRAVLPTAISRSRALVLDADALNAVAADTHLQSLLAARGARAGRGTVMTPHPLEAARLLGCDTAAVQADRLAAARALVRRFGSVVVLKGSGTVVAQPRGLPAINPTGNARLATGGTGDVLAGMIAARLAAGAAAFDAARDAVYLHGLAADRWPADRALTAGALAGAGLH
jgi:hydroxyethylthiazole kinase-like uncharacterized protein yjeF